MPCLREISVFQLLADAELANNVAIPVRVTTLQIIEQTTTFADKHQQASARTMIFLMCLEVLGEFGDSLTQDRNLDFGAARVRLMRAELLDDVCLSCGCQHCFGLLLIV